MPARKFDLAIFDVDGTLLDTREGIVSSVQFTIKECGLRPISDSEIERIFIGPPLQHSFSHTFGLDEQATNRAVATYRKFYSGGAIFRAAPYEGIFDAIKSLQSRGVKIAVASYKRHEYVAELLNKFGFDAFTDNIHGADAEGKLTKGEIIEQCITESGCSDRNRIVMIGDSENDGIGAQKAGIQFIGVTYGYGFQSPKEIFAFNSVACAEKTSDIVTFFEEN